MAQKANDEDGRYRDAAPRRGRCDECGEIETATIVVDGLSGVSGWTCPNCGNVQEPPRPTDEDGEVQTLGEMARTIDSRDKLPDESHSGGADR